MVILWSFLPPSYIFPCTLSKLWNDLHLYLFLFISFFVHAFLFPCLLPMSFSLLFIFSFLLKIILFYIIWNAFMYSGLCILKHLRICIQNVNSKIKGKIIKLHKKETHMASWDVIHNIKWVKYVFCPLTFSEF